MVAIAKIDEIRTLGFAGISGAYAAVGSTFDHLTRIIHITNNTEGDMLFTDDSTKDKIFIASGSFVLIDVQANQNDVFDDKYVLPIGTQIYVKQVTAPVSGSVYISLFY